VTNTNRKQGGARGKSEMACALEAFLCVGLNLNLNVDLLHASSSILRRLHVQNHRPRRLQQASAIERIHAHHREKLTARHHVSNAFTFYSSAAIPFGLEYWRLTEHRPCLWPDSLLSWHVHLWTGGQSKRLSLRLFRHGPAPTPTPLACIARNGLLEHKT
jgi:hypothetical protein